MARQHHELLLSALSVSRLLPASGMIRKLTETRGLRFGLIFPLLGLLMLLSLPAATQAQLQSAMYGTTPAGIAPGTPAGSYALSNVETLDLYSGKPNVIVPLLRVGGRGSAGFTIIVPLSRTTSNYVTSYLPCPPGNGNYCAQLYVIDTKSGSSGAFQFTGNGIALPKYEPGIVEVRTILNEPWNPDPNYADQPNQWKTGITMIIFTSQDGSQHYLWDEVAGGLATTWHPEMNGYWPTEARGRVFSARDGSGMTFVSDSDIQVEHMDYTPSSGNVEPTRVDAATGYLKMSDGTVARIVAGSFQWMRDRNGNLISFGTCANGECTKKITDSLGREVKITIGTTISNAGSDSITYSGFGGAPRTITINYGTLASNLRPNSNYNVGNVAALFPAQTYNGYTGSFSNSGVQVNPNVLSSITLPDNRSWHFYYNPYAELARLESPAGAATEYDYGAGLQEDPSHGYYASGQIGAIDVMHGPFVAIYRRIKERREYANGGSTLTAKSTYSQFDPSATEAKVDDKQFDSDGSTLLGRQLHYFKGLPWIRLAASDGHPIGYQFGDTEAQLEGKEIKTESLDVTSGTVLSRTESEWAGTSTACLDRCGGSWSPQLQSVQASILDTASGNYLVSKKSFSYDVWDNQSDVYEYGFGTNAPGSLMRHSHTDYVTTNNGIDYTSNDNFLRSLPLRQWVKGVDSSGQELSSYASYSENAYDESAYAPQTYGSASGWVDVGSQPRGMVTTVKNWLNLPSVTYLQSHMKYDQFGNLVDVWDAKGNQTHTDYSSSLGYGFATSVTTAVPDPSGQHASSSSLGSSYGYDFSTGRVTSTTDANQQTTTADYTDVLDRLKQVTKPDGGRVRYNYSDTAGDLYVQTLTDEDSARSIETRTYFDNLGRATRSFLYDGTASTPWSVTDTHYDGLGRVSQVSNPYRVSSPSALLPNTCSVCSTTVYDSLSRAISVTTADGASVKTSYSGNRVLVADQDSTDPGRRKRISVTDAAGRLTEVWEVTGSDSWTEAVTFPGWSDVQSGYRTSYNYDALNNLTRITQGTQTPRQFSYDSLKRLLAATNPESGTVSYQYDEDGNLVVKTDARGASIHYAYDALNRVTRRWYNGSSSQSSTVNASPALPSPVAATDEVNYKYDSAINGKGRLNYVSSPLSTYTFTQYDAVGRPTAATQSVVNQTFSIPNIGYDLAGHVTTMTYPSNRIVNYNYDVAGRLADKDAYSPAFAGNLGEGGSSLRTYSSGNLYDEAGRMTKEQLGTTTPIYNKLFYNVRGQLSEIREGTTYSGPADTGWERGAIINHYALNNCWGAGCNSSENNGNLRKQDVYIPGVASPFSQFYDYDALNRLQSVREDNVNGAANWKQSYVYDRYGNRTVDQSSANTYGTNIPKPYFATASNNQLIVPNGMGGAGSMHYDASGNLDSDTYSAQAYTRLYDAENRMTKEQRAVNDTTGEYSYDGDGRRVKRLIGNIEIWQVYGVGGELLAEYAANSSTATPQKEYGYRNGQLLITAGSDFLTAAPPTALGATATSNNNNVTLSWTGSAQKYRVDRKAAGESSFSFLTTATQSSYQDNSAQNGHAYLYKVCAADNSGACVSTYSNITLGARFNFPRDPVICASSDSPSCGDATPVRHEHINELRDAINAVRALAGDAQAWVGQTVNAGDTIYKNDVQDLRDKLNESLQHLGIQTSDYEDNTLAGAPNGTLIKAIHIRQLRQRATSGTGSAGSGGSAGSSSGIHWLVSDQLGTPRMIFDQSGSSTVTDQYGNYVSGMTRHDYLPFGEEIMGGTGGRTSAQGYSGADGVRQQFTEKERDDETGLDYFGSRYYGSTGGRFTSADTVAGSPTSPQSLNLYSYSLNNPLRYNDPTGHSATDANWNDLDYEGYNPNPAQQQQAAQQPQQSQPSQINPPDELMAQIMSMITEDNTVRVTQKNGSTATVDGAVFALDENQFNQITSLLKDAYTLGIQTGSETAAAQGIAVPNSISASVGVSGGVNAGSSGPVPNGGVNIGGNAGRTISRTPAVGAAINTDIKNRASMNEAMHRVAGNLQNTQVTVTTSAQTLKGVNTSMQYWTTRLAGAVNIMYNQGVNAAVPTIPAPAVLPAKPLP